MPRTSKKVFRNGKVHVLAEKCETCIFRPGNLMRLEPGRVAEMVKSAVAQEGSIICHSTLSGLQAVCRGFFDKFATQPLQVADRLGFIQFVDLTDDQTHGKMEPNQ